MTPLTVPLERLDAEHVAHVGGKAANLGALIRAGLPVPPGFCVTTAAFRQFVASCHEYAELYDALHQLDSRRIEEVRAVGARVRQRLGVVPVPPAVAQAVTAAWAALGKERAWAVRSSATVEDSSQVSFAGQQDTFLNVRGAAPLLAAVRSCWISLFSDRAILYRAKHGFDHRSPAMAVVVQELIRADVAGVLFGADPVTGRTDRIIIEGSYGLGQALVSGAVSPDRMVLDKASLRVLEQRITTKSVEAVPDPAGGVQERPVAPQQQQASCLDESTARGLGELACRAEHLFGMPQDIEWALSGGQIFLLQSRPITALRAPASGSQSTPEDHQVWSNVNTGEVLPDVATPMTWSVLRLCIRNLFGPILKRFGVDLDEDPWCALIGGRVYVNLDTFTRVIEDLPVPGRMNVYEAFGGGTGESARPGWLTGRRSPRVAELDKVCVGRLKKLLRVAWLVPWLLGRAGPRRGKAALARCRRRTDELTRVDPAAMPDEELLPFIEAVVVETLRGTDLLLHAAAGMGTATALHRVTKRWLGDADGAVANRLIAQAGGMESAEAALDLWRLSAWARAHAPLKQALSGTEGFAAARQRLAQTEDGREFLTRWGQFMVRHGHHTRGELDVHNPRWSETPDYVLEMVRSFLASREAVDPLEFQRQRAVERERLLADCQRQLRHPLKRLIFNWFVSQAQQGLVLRENFKSQAVRLLTVVRRALLELGDRLEQRGVLPNRDDIFFLELAEVEPVRTGHAEFDVAAAIGTRRAEYARNLTITPPPVIVGAFDRERFIAEMDSRIQQSSGRAASGEAGADGTVLHGLAVSPGMITGPARVILRTDATEQVQPGEILVAPFTDPGWTPYFLTAAAIVMDLGGMLSHGAIVAREYGIPAVVNVGPATKIIKTGQMIRVDGNRGMVTILRAGEPESSK